MKKKSTIGEQALQLWSRLTVLPGGKWLFSRLVGFMIPYTGSMRPLVQHLEAGSATVQLRDRRRVRNHLRSVHAIALANLAEFTTGLATLSAMPPDTRAILVSLEMTYHKKARGLLQASCKTDRITITEEHAVVANASICDAAGDCVASGKATWQIGPEKTR